MEILRGTAANISATPKMMHNVSLLLSDRRPLCDSVDSSSSSPNSKPQGPNHTPRSALSSVEFWVSQVVSRLDITKTMSQTAAAPDYWRA